MSCLWLEAASWTPGLSVGFSSMDLAILLCEITTVQVLYSMAVSG